MQEAALYQGRQTMAQPHPCVLSVALSCYNGRGQEYGCKANNCCHLALYRKSLPAPALDFNRPEFKSRYWLTNKVHIKRPTTGLLMYTLATRFCNQIYLYGFWPFPLDQNQNPVKYHYYDSLKYGYTSQAGPHTMPLEFKALKSLHEQGALKLTVGQCDGATAQFARGSPAASDAAQIVWGSPTESRPVPGTRVETIRPDGKETPSSKGLLFDKSLHA
ncbi:hypothetical protein J1605_017016 [Eschrichtius robustus]|uniref:Alpha-2,8-sialyltransferase 8B n=1 Tax=Eschrichtius robustus TaxID=9764 RepID=A0AB34I2W2_ESCRO|nr:hypothetical protein J1605_017016 [Eschrichtius robustus]